METIRWAWDKRNTYRLAQDLGIPVPRTWFPKTVEDVRSIDAKFPLILKPAIKENFIYEAKTKAWQVNDKEHLVQRFEEAAAFVPQGEMMVQDLIPGGSSEQQYGCGFFFAGQRALGVMGARYVRAHPPDFGRCSTFVETMDLPELEVLSTRFLQAIDYYGLAEVEFRRDPRDGEFKLLDVNARTWGYHSLGAAAGVDFPYMLFEHQIGRPVGSFRARSGVRWLRWVTDLPVGVHGLFLGKWNLLSYLKSIRGTNTEAVFDTADPLPSLVETALIPYLAVTRGY
jgi:predicted ATP-grasp superfamily ATP-dependent carboligase